MFKDAKLENVIFPSLCKQILEADSSIRFVGVANKFGTQIASQYRKGLVPLLTESQSQLSIVESAIRMYTRIGEKSVESKLGILYIKRATFLLENEDYPILMVSLDEEEDVVAKSDRGYVTLNKILSIVKEQIRFDK